MEGEYWDVMIEAILGRPEMQIGVISVPKNMKSFDLHAWSPPTRSNGMPLDGVLQGVPGYSIAEVERMVDDENVVVLPSGSAVGGGRLLLLPEPPDERNACREMSIRIMHAVLDVALEHGSESLMIHNFVCRGNNLGWCGPGVDAAFGARTGRDLGNLKRIMVVIGRKLPEELKEK